MHGLNWEWIALMATAPPAAALAVAWLAWRDGQMILGNLAGTAVIFASALALIMRERIEVDRFQADLHRRRVRTAPSNPARSRGSRSTRSSRSSRCSRSSPGACASNDSSGIAATRRNGGPERCARYESNEPVTVLETSDPAVLAVAKSLLEEAEIPFFAKGEGIQDLFGAGRLGTGFSPVAGPVELQVSADDAAEAQRVADRAPAAGRERLRRALA